MIVKHEILSRVGMASALAGIMVVTFSGLKSWILIGIVLGVAALILIAADSFWGQRG